MVLFSGGVVRQSTSIPIPYGNQIKVVDDKSLGSLGCEICNEVPYGVLFGYVHTCTCLGPWLFVGAREKPGFFGSQKFLVGGFGYRGDGPFPLPHIKDGICNQFQAGGYDVPSNGVEWAMNYKGAVGIRLKANDTNEILHWDAFPDDITDWKQFPHIDNEKRASPRENAAIDNENLRKSVWNCPRQPTSGPTRTPSPSSSTPTYPPTTDPVMPTSPVTNNSSAMPTPPPYDEKTRNPSIKPTKCRKRNRSRKPTSRRTACPSRKPSSCEKTKPDTST